MKSIHENSLLEDEILENKDRFLFALKGANDGLWDWNLLNDEVYYSPRWKSMLGFEDNELENHLTTWEKLVDSDDKTIVLKKVEDLINGKESEFNIEMKMNHKNGSKVVVLSRAFLIRDENDGKPLRLIGTHVDVTELKRSEQLIKQTNTILEMIAMGKPATEVYDAIALMYEARHPGMRCSLLELEDGKLLHGGAPSMPKEYCEAVHGLEIGPNVGSCGASTFTGKRVLVDNIETSPNWADIKDAAMPHGMRCCWSEPIIDSTGKVLGAFGMYYDYPALPSEDESKDLLSAARLASIVMERDQSQKRIRKNENFISEQSKLASMGEMLGNIAHQWRQPLSVITTISTGLKLEEEEGLSDSNRIIKSLDEIVKQTKYLSRTIDDFRTFFRKSKERETLSVVGILDSSLNILEASFKNSSIEVIKTFEFDTKIDALENELTQAFINMLVNSKDAILLNDKNEEERYIFIDTKKVDDCLMIEIRDNGDGIDENVINRVFEPYFTTKHKSVGTGIGLSIAYQIITKRHDAFINVSNSEFKYKNKNYKGACFRIYFDKTEI